MEYQKDFVNPEKDTLPNYTSPNISIDSFIYYRIN